MNMHESYVSLETAKLLKQAGLDWECEQVYYIGDGIDGIIKYGKLCDTKTTILNKKMLICAPTLSVAQRWLREVKHLEVGVNPCWDENEVDYFGFIYDLEKAVQLPYEWTKPYTVYETALDAVIQDCLSRLS